MIKEILEKAIEIEGLIRIVRDGNPSPETYSLLIKKSEEIAALAKLLADETKKDEDDKAAVEDDDIMLSFDDAKVEPEDDAYDKSEKEIIYNVKATQQLPATDKKELRNLRSAFSLNDRFLYSRELFDGDMKMFDSTLRQLEGIEDFSILEDYFYNELDWNPEDEYVKLFMETLKRMRNA